MKYGMKVGKVSLHGFKLVVGWDDGNTKFSCDICANDSFKMLDNVAVIHIVQFTLTMSRLYIAALFAEVQSDFPRK